MILAEGADTVPGWRLLIPLPEEIVWSAIALLGLAKALRARTSP